LKTLYSIEQIEPQQVIQTGCKPLLVNTNELTDYLVKYVKGNVPAHMLARELIAAEFCKLWNIPFPNCALVDSEKLIEIFEKFDLGLKPKTVYDIDYAFFEEFK
jgi:hypothetical protein